MNRRKFLEFGIFSTASFILAGCGLKMRPNSQNVQELTFLNRIIPRDVDRLLSSDNKPEIIKLYEEDISLDDNKKIEMKNDLEVQIARKYPHLDYDEIDFSNAKKKYYGVPDRKYGQDYRNYCIYLNDFLKSRIGKVPDFKWITVQEFKKYEENTGIISFFYSDSIEYRINLNKNGKTLENLPVRFYTHSRKNQGNVKNICKKIPGESYEPDIMLSTLNEYAINQLTAPYSELFGFVCREGQEKIIEELADEECTISVSQNGMFRQVNEAITESLAAYFTLEALNELGYSNKIIKKDMETMISNFFTDENYDYVPQAFDLVVKEGPEKMLDLFNNEPFEYARLLFPEKLNEFRDSKIL